MAPRNLTRTQLLIWHTLSGAPNGVTDEDLIAAVWGQHPTANPDSALKVHVHNVRRKMRDTDRIERIRGSRFNPGRYKLVLGAPS